MPLPESSKKRAVIGCGTGCCMTMMAFSVAVALQMAPLVIWPSNAMPGDSARRAIQPYLAKALLDDDFSQVSAHYTRPDSAMLVGDASGVRWEQSNGGFISLDEPYSLASQSKVISALTIYCVMAKASTNLSLASKPSDFFPEWPTDGTAGRVTLAHLLAFNSGVASPSVNLNLALPGCARPIYAETTPDEHWLDCINEIATYKPMSEPGTVMHYGPWHLMVATGMAMRSMGRPLSSEAWISLVDEELYKPAGIESTPVYEPIHALNFMGWPIGVQLPDFAGGLIMTARELGKLMQAVQFGELLPEAWLTRFLSSDYSENVTEVPLSLPLSSGGWRYAQGHWIACDAAADKFGDAMFWPLEEVNGMCESGRLPEIHHSVGIFGAYAWMDLSTNCFGVFMAHWDRKIQSNSRLTFAISLLVGVAAGFGLLISCSRMDKESSLPAATERPFIPEAVAISQHRSIMSQEKGVQLV